MMRQIKRILLCMLLLSLLLLITACQDALDINKKAIVTTVALDKKGDEIWLYIEVANIQGSESSAGGASPMGSKYYYVKGHGKTLTDARLDVDRQLDQPIYLSEVRTLVLTEDFASQDLLQYLFRLRADETYRKKVITTTTRSDLDEMFQTLNDRNVSVGNSIDNTITSLESQGEAFSKTTARLLENLSDRYCGILLPCIGMANNETTLAGYSVVNGDNVTGFIPIGDCTGITFLKVDKAKVYFNVPYHEDIFAIRTTLTKRRVNAFYQGGEIGMQFVLRFKATVEYGNKNTPYNLDEKALKELKAILTQAIQDQLNIAMDQAQNIYKTDYLQMDDAFRVKYPAVFDRLDWQETFLKARIAWDLKVDLIVSPSLDYGSTQTR